MKPYWYLTNLQAGFEPWMGGKGLSTDAFNATRNGVYSTVPRHPCGCIPAPPGARTTDVVWRVSLRRTYGPAR